MSTPAPSLAPLNVGELYTALILATSPSAMGLALANLSSTPAPTLDDWSAEIANIGDTPAATTALQSLLKDPRFKDFFTRLLQNDSVNGSPVNAASLVQDKVIRFAEVPGTLSVPWPHPPHPAGDDVIRLMNQLKDFKETGGTK